MGQNNKEGSVKEKGPRRLGEEKMRVRKSEEGFLAGPTFRILVK